jgi:hypothetical protein
LDSRPNGLDSEISPISIPPVPELLGWLQFRVVQIHIEEIRGNCWDVDEAGPLANRLAEVANRLRQFYGDGKRACMLDTLTLGGSPARDPEAREAHA